MKKQLCKIITFDSAHKLVNPNLTDEENLEVYGKCYGGKNHKGHGHLYKLEVFIEGEVDNNGFIMNFVDFKKILKEEVHDKYDHQYLNDVYSNKIITTCEIQVSEIWKDLSDAFFVFNDLNNKRIKLVKLILWETPTSCVVLEED